MILKRVTIIFISLLLILTLISQFPLINGVTQESSVLNKVSEGEKVLFARNNGWFSPTNHYSKMAAYFISEGYLIDEVQTEINESVLADVSILYVNTYQTPPLFNATELSAIESFVQAGGGLIMTFIGGGLDFDIQLGSNLGNIYSHSLEIQPSPITNGLSTPYINESSGIFDISVAGTGRAVITTSSDSFHPDTPIIAINTYGEGKVLSCAVATMWDDNYWDMGGNSEIIENYLQWYEGEAEPRINFKVLFARNNSYFTIDNAYSQLATLFESRGYFIEHIQTEINESVLADVGILFVNTYQVANFDENETKAIESFVDSGGGIILSGDGGSLNLGVEITSNYLGVMNSHTLEVFPHPVTAGIPNPIISTSAGIYELIPNGTAQTLVETSPGSTLPNQTIVAANTYGEGKILSTAVNAIWDNANLNNGGNSDLIESYLDWFETEGIKNFVFARNNGYFSPQDAYGELASYMTGFGYIVSELIDEEPTEQLLDETEILFMNDYQVLTEYSAESKDAIEKWVVQGGSMIIVTYGIYTLDLGFRMYSLPGPGTGLYNNDSFIINPHPVTVGVNDLVVQHASGATGFILGNTATVVVKTTADSNSPDRPIIVVNNYYEGKVMGCAASAPWVNTYFDQNKELIKNFIDWSIINTTTPNPWISSPDDVIYDEEETGNTITWTMGGIYPYYYQLFLDEVLYQSGSWSSFPLTINVDGYSAGTYTFSIHIYDHYGRTAMDTVNVVVNEVIITTTEETTDSTPTTTSTPNSFLAMISGIVLISSLIVYKRRK